LFCRQSKDVESDRMFYINDPDGRLIHCCNHQRYLFVNHLPNFGICSFENGDLVLISIKDILLLH